jgi:hypothetical protein
MTYYCTQSCSVAAYCNTWRCDEACRTRQDGTSPVRAGDRRPARLRWLLDDVWRLVGAGRLLWVRRGVYRLRGVEPTWQSAALAAVLAAGEGAVLSHRSAAVLWGLLDRHRESGPLEVIVRSQCRLDGVRAHRHRLAPAETTRRLAIPVTTAERTLLDLAQSIPEGELGRLCDEALRRRLTTLARLQAVVDAHRGGGRRRLRPIQAVLADQVPGYDPGANDWEQRMDRLWDQLGLPPAERQYRVRVGGGAIGSTGPSWRSRSPSSGTALTRTGFEATSTATAIAGPRWHLPAGTVWTSSRDRGRM